MGNSKNIHTFVSCMHMYSAFIKWNATYIFTYSTEMKRTSLSRSEPWMGSLSLDAAWDSSVGCPSIIYLKRPFCFKHVLNKYAFCYPLFQDTTSTRRGWSRVCTATHGTTSPTCSPNTCQCNQQTHLAGHDSPLLPVAITLTLNNITPLLFSSLPGITIASLQ